MTPDGSKRRGSKRSRRREAASASTIPQTKNPVEAKAGVLTGQEITDLGLVEGGAPGCFKAASCDLRLGSEVFECGKGSKDYLVLGLHTAGVTIPPFGTILFSTAETIVTPRDVVGRFDLKIKEGLAGLVLQVGPQVEPCYTGPLFGMILNAGGHDKTISYLDPFLAIEFSYTSREPKEELIDEKKIESLREFVAGRVDLDRIASPSIVVQLRDEIKASRQIWTIRRKKWGKSLRFIFNVFLVAITFFVAVTASPPIWSFLRRLFDQETQETESGAPEPEADQPGMRNDLERLDVSNSNSTGESLK